MTLDEWLQDAVSRLARAYHDRCEMGDEIERFEIGDAPARPSERPQGYERWTEQCTGPAAPATPPEPWRVALARDFKDWWDRGHVAGGDIFRAIENGTWPVIDAAPTTPEGGREDDAAVELETMRIYLAANPTESAADISRLFFPACTFCHPDDGHVRCTLQLGHAGHHRVAAFDTCAPAAAPATREGRAEVERLRAALSYVSSAILQRSETRMSGEWQERVRDVVNAALAAHPSAAPAEPTGDKDK